MREHSDRQRVLVLGASGMTGRAIQQLARAYPQLDLVRASHREVPGYVTVPYASLDTAQAWKAILQDAAIDIVVNCVGIWTGDDAEFEQVQYVVPVALFDACAQTGRRVVHVSALGFSPDSPLPYASTKVRADRYLLESSAPGTVVYPSLVFGPDGLSSRFFLSLAALPIQVDFGFAKNLQPVPVEAVAKAVLDAAVADGPPRQIECAGPRHISATDYLAALRKGMGLPPAVLSIRPPRWVAGLAFNAGELLGSRFINRQTWELLKEGTCSAHENPQAVPYEQFSSTKEATGAKEVQLYWATRLGVAFLWLWTAVVSMWYWPQTETLAWLNALYPGLGKPGWLAASCALDAAMGLCALFRPSTKLWRIQLGLVACYSLGLSWAIPAFWAHPFGPLTKNIAVLSALGLLALHEPKRTA